MVGRVEKVGVSFATWMAHQQAYKTKTIDGETWFSVGGVALVLGCCPETVRRLMSERRLPRASWTVRRPGRLRGRDRYYRYFSPAYVDNALALQEDWQATEERMNDRRVWRMA
jgi:hypothetical protein